MIDVLGIHNLMCCMSIDCINKILHLVTITVQTWQGHSISDYSTNPERTHSIIPYRSDELPRWRLRSVTPKAVGCAPSFYGYCPVQARWLRSRCYRDERMRHLSIGPTIKVGRSHSQRAEHAADLLAVFGRMVNDLHH